MLLVGTDNAATGIEAGWAVLVGGGSALDAVEVVVRDAESDPEDHTAGYGGYPNILGEVELDASLMDGDTRRVGAVAAVRGRRHAISVARAVMDRLPHVMLVGDGAERLADAEGVTVENLLTPEAQRVWREGLDGRLPAEFAEGSGMVADMLVQATQLAADPEQVRGTVNSIAIDERGSLASAVSSSGWAWKFPGRVGDSPIVGAGNYADSRYGAATCSGWGELAVRCGTAGAVVRSLKAGVPVDESCRDALADIGSLPDLPDGAAMSLLAVDDSARHCGVSSLRDVVYVWRTDGMATYETAPRIHFPLRPVT